MRTESRSVPRSIFWPGWILFSIWVLISLGLTIYLFAVRPPIGVIVFGLSFGLAGLWLATSLHEIRDPDQALLFRRGRFRGVLPAGWYLTVPHSWDIKIVPLGWRGIEFEGSMYTKEETEIAKVKVRVQYRVLQDQTGSVLHPDRILRMPPQAMRTYGAQAVEARVRAAVGRRSFKDLVAAKRDPETEVLQELQTEGKFAKYGYEIGNVEIVSFSEKVRSRASEIEALGKARGVAARAVAEPLKDNWPAAAVSAATAFADTGERIAGKLAAVWLKHLRQDTARKASVALIILLAGCGGTVPISKYFGEPVAPELGGRHRGIDIPAFIGTPVIAAAEGIVSFAGHQTAGCGIGVYIQHRLEDGRGFVTRYCHLSEDLPVKDGAVVKMGEVIGFIGRTGRTGGIDHVHFEILESGYRLVDPLKFIVGCFDPKKPSPNGFTYPIRC